MVLLTHFLCQLKKSATDDECAIRMNDDTFMERFFPSIDSAIDSKSGSSLYQIYFRKILEIQVIFSWNTISTFKKLPRKSLIDYWELEKPAQNWKRKFNLSCYKCENELIHCHCKDFSTPECQKVGKFLSKFSWTMARNHGSENNKSTLETEAGIGGLERSCTIAPIKPCKVHFCLKNLIFNGAEII